MILRQGLATDAAADLVEMAATMAVFGIETTLLLREKAANDFINNSGMTGTEGRMGIAELSELDIRIFINGSGSDAKLSFDARMLDSQQACQLMDAARHITGW